MVSAIFKHTNDKTYHKILSKNVFNPGLNVYIFSCKLHLLQGVWTNPHSQKACMVSLELFRISTSFPTVGGRQGVPGGALGIQDTPGAKKSDKTAK